MKKTNTQSSGSHGRNFNGVSLLALLLSFDRSNDFLSTRSVARDRFRNLDVLWVRTLVLSP